MDAQSARPVAAIDRLPVELLLVIILEASRTSYQWTALRDRHTFIMGLAEVSRRFREISIELRNKVVFLDLPNELERAEESGQLSKIVLEAKHITATRIDSAGSLVQSTPPPPPQPGPFDFLFTNARDPVPPLLALDAGSTFSGTSLLSLHPSCTGLILLSRKQLCAPFISPTSSSSRLSRLGFLTSSSSASASSRSTRRHSRRGSRLQ